MLLLELVFETTPFTVRCSDPDGRVVGCMPQDVHPLSAADVVINAASVKGQRSLGLNTPSDITSLNFELLQLL